MLKKIKKFLFEQSREQKRLNKREKAKKNRDLISQILEQSIKEIELHDRARSVLAKYKDPWDNERKA